MMTDANCPGTEKLVCTPMKAKWKTGNHLDFSDLTLPDNSVQPETLFMVKGWNRATCCLAVLMAAYEFPVLYQAGYDLHQRRTNHLPPPCCRKCSPSLGMGPRSSVISVIRVCGWRSGDPRRSNHVFGAIKYGQTVSNPINILSKYVEMLLELYYSNTIKPKDSIHHDSL